MGKPLHDLIIEDSKADTDLLLRELRRVGYEVEFERVETMEAMQVALTEKTWDLILSDYTMPKFSALQTLEVLKASRFDPPFIIISGTIGEEMAVAALKAGANNYLSKENLAKLGQVVEQELREAEIRLEHRQALKTSEELFGTAFHHSPVGICITTLDGKLQNISQSLLDMLGFTRAELEGKHFNDITYPDDLEIGKDAVGSMMAGKVPSVSFEKRYLHKSGEPVWALVSSSLLRDSSGQPVHFITHILDMTERKQAEEQIRAHAARLKVLADASQTFATAVQDYQVMLEMVARQTAEALGGSCGVRLLSEDGKWLEMVAMHDVDVAALKLTRTLSNQPLRADEPNFVQRVLQSQQALLMPGISEDQLRAVVKPEDWTHLKYIASHSRLLAPIRTRSEALGFLIISRKVGSPAFDEHDLSLAQDLADRAALAISNARLFKQVQNELTERKQTEESLRQSEERFSKAFEANQAAMALIRIDNLLILDVNNSFYELTGFTREEAIGHPSPELNFITPEERKRAIEESQRQGGVLHNFEMMVHRKDGGVRYALYSSERIDLEQVPCVLAILYDITERKRAEDALRESEIKFSAAFHSSPLALVITTLDGKFIEVNQAFCYLIGYSREEIIGNTATSLGLLSVQDRERLVNVLESADGSVSNFEVQFRVRDGSLCDILYSLTPISLHGIPHRLITGINITERKRAEEKIAYQSHLLENVNDAVLATDIQFNITSWNRAAEEMYGYEEEEVLGRTAQEFIRSDFSDEQRAAAVQALNEGGSYRTEVLQYNRDGHSFWVDGSTFALREANGQTYGYVSINRDISKRKRAEQQVQRQLKQLNALRVIDNAICSSSPYNRGVPGLVFGLE